MKAAERGLISISDSKSHFENVSRERYEEDPSVIASVIERVNDMRLNGRAIAANERMNEMPDREEIVKAMREMKDSAPGEDGVRLRYIANACDDVRGRVIEIVRMMFERRANEWDERAKSGIIVPLF